MFVKVFRQIFESSIAEDYELRHIFMDLLVLSDLDGIIDMTHEAISRITNVPEDKVRRAIEELEKPDLKSRTDTEDGCRLIRLDDHRDWGWRIVNYQAYRAMRDEEARKAYFRERKRAQRAAEKNGDCPTLSTHVLDCPTLSPMQKKKQKKKEKENIRVGETDAPPHTLDQIVAELKPIYPWVDTELESSRIRGWMFANPGKRKLTKRFVVNWFNKVERPINIQPLQHQSPILFWKPPTYEIVKAYALAKRWSSGFARHCFDTWVANGWKHFGKPIASDEQWKAIMNTMEYRH